MPAVLAAARSEETRKEQVIVRAVMGADKNYHRHLEQLRLIELMINPYEVSEERVEQTRKALDYDRAPRAKRGKLVLIKKSARGEQNGSRKKAPRNPPPRR